MQVAPAITPEPSAAEAAREVITAPEATQAAALPAANQESRAQVTPPNLADVSIMPTSKPVELPVPPPTVVKAMPASVPAAAHSQLAEEIAAEKPLAAAVGSKLTAFTEGLNLTLYSEKRNGAIDVKLAFDGPTVAQHASELGAQIIAALQTIPAMVPYFEGSHKPHAQSVPGHASSLEIHVPQLDLAHYTGLLTALGTSATINQAAGVFKQEAANDAVSTDTVTPETPKIENSTIEKPKVEASEIQNPVLTVDAAAKLPDNVIATPAANDARIVPEPQLAN
ncbi:MAG: hypothetical protein ACOYNL_08350, partial [Rickettsiales bacterium]